MPEPQHPKLDLHTHILPERWPDLRERYGYAGFPSLEHCGNCRAKLMVDGAFFREIVSNCWDPAARLGDCAKSGVTVQALATLPLMFAYWTRPEDGHDLAQMLNDHIAGVVRDFPTRFVGLGTVPLQDGKLAAKELERCVKQLGFPGVQIGTNVGGLNLDHPGLFDFFAAAQDLNAAVFVHPWEMLGRERLKDYWLPWLVGMPAETAVAICSMIFGGVFERLPNLRVGFAHGGGAFAGCFGRIEHGFHARPDLVAVRNAKPPGDYLGRFWVDSLVHCPDALKLIVHRFGQSRVALGTDYPFPLGEDEPGKLIESLADFDAGLKRRLLWDNALEFLALDSARFGVPQTPSASAASGASGGRNPR